MKIAICDDLETDRKILTDFLALFSNEESTEFSIEQFENGEKLLSALNSSSFQIIFLDIYMNGQKGIDVARVIKESYPNTIIIFTTTSREFAIESYSLNVEGYLVKPFNYASFKKVFLKHYESHKLSSSFIVINVNKIPTKIQINDIIFLEIYSRQCVIHTLTEIFDTKINTNEILDILIKNNLFRVSRNFLINFKYVTHLNDDSFILKDGSKIPIPVRSKTKCIDAYSNYLWNN